MEEVNNLKKHIHDLVLISKSENRCVTIYTYGCNCQDCDHEESLEIHNQYYMVKCSFCDWSNTYRCTSCGIVKQGE